MAGRKNRAYVGRVINSFNDALTDPEFVRNIEGIRQSRASQQEKTAMIVLLMQRFKLPSNSYGYIEHYINTGEQDITKIISPVGFINQANEELFWNDYSDPTIAKTGYKDYLENWDAPLLALIINHETKSTDIKQYIDDHWKDIKKSLERTDNRKIRQTRNTKNKDIKKKISELYFKKKMKPAAIAKELELEPFEVNKMLSELKKKSKEK